MKKKKERKGSHSRRPTLITGKEKKRSCRYPATALRTSLGKFFRKENVKHLLGKKVLPGETIQVGKKLQTAWRGECTQGSGHYPL